MIIDHIIYDDNTDMAQINLQLMRRYLQAPLCPDTAELANIVSSIGG